MSFSHLKYVQKQQLARGVSECRQPMETNGKIHGSRQYSPSSWTIVACILHSGRAFFVNHEFEILIELIRADTVQDAGDYWTTTGDYCVFFQ